MLYETMEKEIETQQIRTEKNQGKMKSTIPNLMANLQDIDVHKVTESEIQNVLEDVNKVEREKGEVDRSNNIHKMSLEADLSPTTLVKSRKKTRRKPNQEVYTKREQQPTMVLGSGMSQPESG